VSSARGEATAVDGCAMLGLRVEAELAEEVGLNEIAATEEENFQLLPI